ncbi:MAG: phenylalanine--tRNA ligase subunit alpha [bacterium]
MQNKLKKIKEKAIEEIEKIKNSDALKDLEVKYLGRKGELTEILRGISDLVLEEKKAIGKMANEMKIEIEGALEKASDIIKQREAKEGLKGEWIDVSIPSLEKKERGSLHPLTQAQNEIEYIFTSMGFMILDGPEIESEYYNFEALNIPSWHPARDMQDTFYVKSKVSTKGESASGGKSQKACPELAEGSKVGESDDENRMVMRTQTSAVQVRGMQKYGAPIKAIVPGRCFRNEATDASHDHTFYQVEGLMVDKDISIANLIATMKTLLKAIFKKDVKVRLRPGYFPFVEPGFELDINCLICNGKGCSVCKHSGWVELMPCGMVHPNVLRYGGVDPDEYSGFAFGLGLTRIVMMKYGINDIRLLLSGDLRFLKQF